MKLLHSRGFWQVAEASGENFRSETVRIERMLVHLVYVVYLVCLVNRTGNSSRRTRQTRKTGQPDRQARARSAGKKGSWLCPPSPWLFHKQPHCYLLSFNPGPTEGLNDLAGQYFRHFYQGKAIHDFDRTDHI